MSSACSAPGETRYAKGARRLDARLGRHEASALRCGAGGFGPPAPHWKLGRRRRSRRRYVLGVDLALGGLEVRRLLALDEDEVDRAHRRDEDGHRPQDWPVVQPVPVEIQCPERLVRSRVALYARPGKVDEHPSAPGDPEHREW